jgi:hypothetical protein
MAFVYPAEIDTPWEKVRYIFRLKEYLRLLHNYAGLWLREGLTQDQYDNGVDSGLIAGTPGQQFVLTDQIKNQYPYQQNISKPSYDNFIVTEWSRRFHIVEDEIHSHIDSVSVDATFDDILDLNF